MSADTPPTSPLALDEAALKALALQVAGQLKDLGLVSAAEKDLKGEWTTLKAEGAAVLGRIKALPWSHLYAVAGTTLGLGWHFFLSWMPF